MQFELRNLFPPFEHLREYFHQIHKRNDQLPFRLLATVKRFIRMRPNVILNLLLLVEQLRGVLEFLVFEQSMDQFVARILLAFRPRQWVGRQKHLGFDVDQRGSHVDKIGRNVDIKFL